MKGKKIMKSLTKKLFLIACTIVLLALCSNLKSQQILVEGAVSNGWEYSIMQVTGGSSYAYDVKPTTTLSGSVTIPDYLGGCPVKALAEGAFKNCTELTSIQIPCTVTAIPKETFYGCSKLAYLNFSNYQCNISRIDAYGFYDCKALTSINLSKVTSIGPWAFYNCETIQMLKFSENLTSISSPNAFASCNSLTSIEFSSSALEIGSYCFNNCDSLKTVSFSEDMESLRVLSNGFYNCSSLSILNIPCDADLGEQAFYNCYGLTQVTFFGKTTFSNRSVFACSNNTNTISDSQKQLTVLFKDDALLKSSAFSGNKQLSELTFEKNVVFSGVTPLSETASLKKVVVMGDFTDEASMNIGETAVETMILGGNVISNLNISKCFPKLSKVVYKGNTVDSLISGSTMIFEDTATCVSGTIDGNVTEEVIFYNPSTNLDGITLSGEEKKTKFYGLKGSTAETLFEKYKDNSYFCNLILSDWDFRVSAEHNTFDWNTGEAMPNLTPEMLGLTVQVTYYKEASARNISYSPKDPLKGYQLEIPDLKEGENTISVKYSGWSKNLTITLQNKKQMLPATSTPTVLVTQTPSATSTVSATQTLSPTSTVSATQTLSPTSTVSATQTLSPTSTVSVTQTPSATSTVSATQTLSPTSTVSVAQTPSATSTTPTLSPTSTVSVSTGGAVVRYPSPTLKASETQPPNPTSAAPKVSDFPEVTATPKVPQKNKTYFVKNIKYKVLSFKGKTGTASIVGYNKAASSLQLTSTVKIFNYTLRVTKINAKAFRNCQKLFGKLVIPKYVTSIGSSAFYNCKKLTSVTLPKRLTSIGASAFQNCKNLQYVIINGKNIKKVGKKAFFNNSKVPARKFNMPTKYISYYRKIFIYKKQYN